jgi:hypothetical protein
LLRFVVVAQIIIAIGHTKSALAGLRNYFGTVLVVLPRKETEEHVRALALQKHNGGVQSLAIGDGIDSRKVGGNRFEASRVNGSSVHAAGVEITDLLLIGTGGSGSF